MGKVGMFLLSAAKIVAGVILTATGIPAVGVPLIVSGTTLGVTTALAPRPLADGGWKSSPTYGAAGFANGAFEGMPKRIVLGQVRTPPAFVSAVTEQRGRKQYMKAALYVCDGGPHGIESIDDVWINDQPVEHYRKVTLTKLLGTSTQEAPKGFEKVSIPYRAEGHLGKDDTFVWTTHTEVDEVAVLLNWRSGLYYFSSRDGLEAKSSTIKVEVRLETASGSGSWVTVSPTSKAMGDGWERSKNGHWKAREKRQAPYHNIIRVTLRGSDADVNLDLSAAAKVTIRLTGLNENGSSSKCEPDVEQVEEVVSDDRDYAGAAMLYIEAVAQEQLSGAQLFKVSCVVKGWKCTDPRTSTVAWTQNPAVQLREVLLDEDVGAGKWLSSSDLDDDYIEDAADVCDENAATSGEHKEARFRCDGVIDTIAPVPDWIDEILLTMRGALVEWGGKLVLVQDKAGTFDRHFDATSSPGAGTRPVILTDEEENPRPAISLQYIDHDRRPNVVAVAFRNEENDYAQDWTDDLGADDLGADEQEVRAEIPITFVTRPTQAVREARYWLNRGRLRTELLTLGISRGDFDLVPMDVVRVSTDYPTLAAVDFQVLTTRYGPGGRGTLHALRCHADAYDDTDDSAPTKAQSLTRAEALKAAGKQPWPAKSLRVNVVHR